MELINNMEKFIKENWFRVIIIILWAVTLIVLTSGEVRIKNKQFEPGSLLPSLGEGF